MLAKRGGTQSPFSVLSSPHFLSIIPVSHLFQLLLQQTPIPTSAICPTCLRPSPFYTTPTPSPPIFPLYPYKKRYKSGGKFIRSKNKHVSVSLRLPCRVPQGCSVLWMDPVCLRRLGSTHTHTPTPGCTHFPKDTQKQLSIPFSGFVIAIIPPQANLALVLSCGFTTERMGLSNKVLLPLSISSL